MTADTIYSDDYIAEQTRRFGQFQPFRRPFLFKFITEQRFAPWRRDLQRWIGSVPEIDRKVLIEKLRNPDLFISVANELTIAGQFIEIGHSVEYEPDIDGLTPDWLICSSRHNKCCFILETFSSNLANDVETTDRSRKRLVTRLNELQIDALVDVKLDPKIRCLADHEIKKACHDVSKWVTDLKTKSGDSLKSGPLIFRFYERSIGFSNLQVGSFGPWNWVSSEKIRENCELKVKKYQRIIDSRKLPFVVAVKPDSRTGEGLEEFVEALCSRTDFDLQRPSTNVLIAEGVLSSDSLFAKQPSISAGVFVDRSTRGTWSMAVILNPNAINPIPGEVFS